MKPAKLKTPEDYEIFSFRATKAEKEQLNTAIDEVVRLYNKDRDEDKRVIRKNDVIMEALEKGLTLIKRNKLKK